VKNREVRRILYVPPRGIGDIMFSMPLLHSLRVAYPQAEIYVPITRDKQMALDLVGFVNPTNRFLPKPADDFLAAERWQASLNGDKTEKFRLEKLIYEKYLAGEQFDIALIPKDFTIDAIGCPRQVCSRDVKKAGIIRASNHMVDGFLAFADYLGIPKNICFDLDIDIRRNVALSSGWELKSDKPYVVLNLGASLGRKVWSEGGYSETASWCLDNGLNVVLVGDKDSFDRASQITDGESRVFNTVLRNSYSMDLKNLALLSLKSTALVSPDTGILHIGDAIGANVIGLYGHTSPQKYGPYNNLDNVVSRFDGDKLVKNIPSKQVIEKLEEVIQIK